MRDLMLGFQVLTGSTTFFQLLHVCFVTTQTSAPVIPAAEFYNSKDVFFCEFLFLTAELCTELDLHLSSAALAFSSHSFHVFERRVCPRVLKTSPRDIAR